MKSFFIEVLGCQQNEYDAAKLSAELHLAGFCEVENPKEAKYIFILACSVRQTAVDRIFGRIRNWKDKKIFITGCVLDDDRKNFSEKGVVYFSDSEEFKQISGLKLKNNLAVQQFNDNVFYIPIMSGCNNFCSYCVVPYTRGREKSRSIDEILFEAKRIIFHFSTAQPACDSTELAEVRRGRYGSEKPEVILLGQNVNSYEFGFVELLKKINDLSGDFQISFLSNHPKDMTDDIIEAVAKLPKIKKEVHLPLQSGSDRILKLMNRPYDSKQYLKLAQKLTAYNLQLTTDIIVGFPGETESDFQKTVNLCKKVGFKLAYINKYSPRKGTAAYKLSDPIPWKEKQRKWRILNELINKK
ncbi:MAG: bifunctional enzyme involved in thiolation and methylation of tRNA [Candidatus Berkelbacteria bacterium Athens1014_28]|uniref:Bifunctional enzyme involved in thiolation and methylation of tRNA n=1 Tax=Candidatus Berkelbacteria bacterium Athens1014_28 TaxID=2017145 RepID=A0A554LKY2_9BACT|nr:MAG: bifunctional enzyme involved in thiolation and methylation of tRNA [Candidatus Berkelbacteria bacterium Athens1014_28]